MSSNAKDWVLTFCSASRRHWRRFVVRRTYPLVHKELRRMLIRRFPYGLFYLMEEGMIVLLAVFHARRDPKQWQSRA